MGSRAARRAKKEAVMTDSDGVKVLAEQILNKLDTVETLLQEIRQKADRLASQEKEEQAGD